jgi:RsiW-degrading membrane proteinase PrsW (M82 family)
MHGIFLTALLTSALALAIFGTLVHRLPQPASERLLWLAFALVLPMQPLAFYLLRVPLDHWLVSQLGSSSAAYQWALTLYAPLTEEAAKLLPLLLPAIRRDLRPGNFVRYAIAIGLGFALGEMWFIAERVNRNPAMAGIPFYQFGGYTVERLMTCVFHAFFVSMPLWQWRGRRLLGFAGAVTLHWLGNLPISLMIWDIGGFGRSVWLILVQVWLAAYLLVALSSLSYFSSGQRSLGRLLYGRRRCPECSAEYDGPFLAINMGAQRYECCPVCRRWHWTQPASSPPKKEEIATPE